MKVTKRNGDLAEALMEFGALICKPKDPKCYECEINKACSYYTTEKKIRLKRKKSSKIKLSDKKQKKQKKKNLNKTCTELIDELEGIVDKLTLEEDKYNNILKCNERKRKTLSPNKKVI